MIDLSHSRTLATRVFAAGMLLASACGDPARLTKTKSTTLKNTLFALLGFILLSTPLAATAQQSGDFTYTSDGSAITITGYTGPGGAVTIPATIAGLPVTCIRDGAFQYKSSLTSTTIQNGVASIGDSAFAHCTSLTDVRIPGSVTSFGGGPFYDCTSLIAITVEAANASYISLDGVLFNKNLTTLIQYPGGKTGSYAIPGSITSIGNAAFRNCPSLKGVFFKGNAPNFGSGVFIGANNATVYYLPGTTGWGATFAGKPTVLWNPLMQTSDPCFGVGPAGFGFNITGTTNIPIVVEACTNLANATWVPMQSLYLTNGTFHFSDPDWTNYPARNYRIRSP